MQSDPAPPTPPQVNPTPEAACPPAVDADLDHTISFGKLPPVLQPGTDLSFTVKVHGSGISKAELSHE